MLNDLLEIQGLTAILDEDVDLTYVDLRVRCGERSFRIAVLTTGDAWTVNVRDERGRSVPGSGDVYHTQADAILAALVIVLDVANRSSGPAPLRASEALDS